MMLSKLSPSKIWNAINVLGSYWISRFTGSPSHFGLPLSLSIEPTTACNLRCPECPSGLRSFTRPTGKMDLELLNKILNEVKSHCTYINFYFQGEPYIHPQFLDMVRLCRKYKIYSATSTNAHFLNTDKAKETVQSGLDRLIISIDGTDQSTYESYRKEGDLSKVIKGAKNILHWKKELKSMTPHVIFQFLVVKPNEHQIEEVKKLGAELGVDEIRFKTAQIYDFENGNELIPTRDEYSRYKKTASGKWVIKNSLDNHCWRMWSGAVITWDGRVVPCCFDKDAAHSMGNLQKQSFKEIWNNQHYKQFRASILRSRSEIEMCKNCSEGTQVFG
jgi:radical SAM protein with 4Fe4S-binding SPASM domain